MLSVYETRKDPDGFLYIVYTEESTLGNDDQERMIGNDDQIKMIENGLI